MHRPHSLKYQHSKVLLEATKKKSKCPTLPRNRKKNVEKSTLFSIAGKRLIVTKNID